MNKRLFVKVIAVLLAIMLLPINLLAQEVIYYSSERGYYCNDYSDFIKLFDDNGMLSLACGSTIMLAEEHEQVMVFVPISDVKYSSKMLVEIGEFFLFPCYDESLVETTRASSCPCGGNMRIGQTATIGRWTRFVGRFYHENGTFIGNIYQCGGYEVIMIARCSSCGFTESWQDRAPSCGRVIFPEGAFN